MSHFVTIQTQIKDLDALREACGELGLELLANTEARGFYGSRRTDQVIRLKGPYDIAADRQADGRYALTTDWWNVSLRQGCVNGFLLVA